MMKRVIKIVMEIVIKIVIKRRWSGIKVINYGPLATLLTDCARVTQWKGELILLILMNQTGVIIMDY